MNNTLLKTSLLMVCSASLLACGGSSDDQPPTTSQEQQPLSVPDGFDYNMNRDITLRVQVLDHNGLPADRIGVQVYQPDTAELSAPEEASPAISANNALISRGQTDALGYFEQQIRIPGHLSHVKVQVSQLGIHNIAELEINTETVFHEFK